MYAGMATRCRNSADGLSLCGRVGDVAPLGPVHTNASSMHTTTDYQRIKFRSILYISNLMVRKVVAALIQGEPVPKEISKHVGLQFE